MFQRWLSHQQPFWLVATIFLVGVAFEIQAPYHKKATMIDDTANFRADDTGESGPSVELAKKNR